MFAKSGLIVCPWPVPVSLTRSLPSSMTPTCIHFRINRSTLLSPDSLLDHFHELFPHDLESKYAVTSISRTTSVGRVQMTRPTSSQRLIAVLFRVGTRAGRVKKILLTNGMQYSKPSPSADLILQGRNRDWSLFPVSLGIYTLHKGWA